MQAYNASYSRKLNRGRPNRFKASEKSYILEKKQELFEKHEAQKEAMNLISLSYHLGKLTKEEFDIACFLEHLCLKAQKSIGVKKMPTSSPNTWNISIQNIWHNINGAFEDSHAETSWRKIKDFVASENPKIASEFFTIITAHYSYEELKAVKTGTFNITNTLKTGLQIVAHMLNLGYL